MQQDWSFHLFTVPFPPQHTPHARSSTLPVPTIARDCRLRYPTQNVGDGFHAAGRYGLHANPELVQFERHITETAHPIFDNLVIDGSACDSSEIDEYGNRME
jgi:hypothetical protein